MPRGRARTSAPKFRRRRFKAVRRRFNRYIPRRTRGTAGGFVCIRRKCPEVVLTNTTAGNYNITDPTGNMLASTGVGVATGFLNTFDIPFSMKFSLSQIINSSELTAMCDKYKLKKTVIRIYYNHNSSSATVANSALPQLSYYYDYDDAIIPTTSQVREKMGVKIKYYTSSRNMIKITLYPRPTTEVYNTGITTAYGVGRQQWIDSAYPQCEHYGIKGVFQNCLLPGTANTTGFKWDVEHVLYGKYLQ